MPTASRSLLVFGLLFLMGCGTQSDYVPLFNGRDLTGWRNVNTAPDTWTVRDEMIVTTGIPTGVLCTERQYENFELEWKRVEAGGNAGLFVHSDGFPARGQPFTRSIECQIMDGNGGDVFAIQGATMVPDRPHPRGAMRSLPIENRAHPAGEWNHYRVDSQDGVITLAVNGNVVSGGSETNARRGYICLEAEGSEVHFRDIRIRERCSRNGEATNRKSGGFDALHMRRGACSWSSAPSAQRHAQGARLKDRDQSRTISCSTSITEETL